MKNWIKAKIAGAIWKSGILESHDILLKSYYLELAKSSNNPIHKGTFFGGFSQLDEYYILNKILERISPTSKKFMEFGVGKGSENNTLGLLLDGWHGIWVGNEELVIEIPFDSKENGYPESLEYIQTWIDMQALNSLLPQMKALEPSLVSMDLDGNDYHFTEFLLSAGILPDIYIQEYNANFGPNAIWIMPYRNDHQWDLSTQWGASLAAYVNLFHRYGYMLVACSLSGVNAFFVRRNFKKHFLDIPTDLSQIYNSYTPWFERTKQLVHPRILKGSQ